MTDEPTTARSRMEAEAVEQRVRDSFARQGLMRHLDASLDSVAPGVVTISIPSAPTVHQQHGFVHAGAVSSILDSACGYAAFTLMPPGKAVLTVEFKVNLLRPATGSRVVATGRVVRAGRTLSVVTGEALAGPEGSTVIAVMQATIMAVDERPGLVD